MTAPPAPLDLAGVNALLVAGIQGQKVSGVADEILARPVAAVDAEARAPANSARAACDAISKQMRDLRQELRESLLQAGVSASPEQGPEDLGHLQFHATALRIAPEDLAKSVQTLQALGFRTPIALTPGRLRIIARTATALRLVRFDATSARVELRFSDQSQSRLPRVLHPRLTDLGVIDLPNVLSWAYWFVRPLRIASARLFGSRPRVGENDLLGTPESLIEPILELLQLSASDQFIDLGCGDGRVVAAAAGSGCHAIGYEIDEGLVNAARTRCTALRDGSGRTDIFASPAETADLSNATVVYVFLPRYILERILQNLQNRVAPTTRIIAHEQNRIASGRPPDILVPLFGADAMTVVHIWT